MVIFVTTHAQVSIHPSHSVMIPTLGEDEADILAQVTNFLTLMFPLVSPGGGAAADAPHQHRLR